MHIIRQDLGVTACRAKQLHATKGTRQLWFFKDRLVKRPMYGCDSDIILYPLGPDALSFEGEPGEGSGPSNTTKQG